MLASGLTVSSEITEITEACGADRAAVSAIKTATGRATRLAVREAIHRAIGNSAVRATGRAARTATRIATVARRLQAGGVDFDAAGRKVADPISGIFFVIGGAGRSEQGGARVRQVVVQR